MPAKPSLSRGLTVVICVLLLPGGLAAQSATTGTITGQVLDGAGGEPLAGAEVKVDGTGFITATDQNGRYRIAGIPPGEYTLVIDFLGFGRDSTPISVKAGELVRHDIKLSLRFGEEVTVSAPLLEGEAKALNQQRTAPNIISVVAADQIAGFPDPNIAEAAQRVAGVSLQRDDGEGEVMLIRGVDPKLNSITMNGERIPSTEPTTRAVNSISIASDILQSIEVVKSLRPDLDGDAIGGVVNFVTKQAPEETTVYGTAELGYHNLRGQSNPRGSITWGRRFVDRRLGVIASGSAHDENRRNETIEVEYVAPVLDRITFRDEGGSYQRYSGNGAVDWLAQRYTLTLRSTFARQDQDKIRHRDRFERIPLGITGTGGRIRTEVRDRTRRRDTWTNALTGTYVTTGEWLVDYSLAYNVSDRREPDTLINRYEQGGIRYAPFTDPENDFYINPNPLNRDLRLSTFRFFQVEQLFTRDRDLVAAANVRLPLGGRAPGYVKFGYKFRDKNKTNDQNSFEYTSSGLPTLATAETTPSSPGFLDGFFQPGPFLPVSVARNLFESTTWSVRRVPDVDSFDFRASEAINAGYGMVEVNVGPRLLIMGGARYERTDSTYTGNTVLGTAIAPIAGDRSFDQILPMGHFRYAFDENSNLRFAVTRSMARPSYYDLVPYSLINTEDDTIIRGNPDLRPTDATNVDVFFERYFASVGVMGVGFFYKHLEDPIFTRVARETVAGEEFLVTEPVNGDSGDISGLELYYQQRLQFLPGPFDGVGVLANYVYTSSDAVIPGRPVESVFPGQSDHSGNLAISYEKRGFTGRLAFNYSGEYLFTLGANAPNDIIKMDHSQWDLTLRQQVTRNLGVYVNILNVNDARDREYWGDLSRKSRNEKYSWWGTTGVRFEF